MASVVVVNGLIRSDLFLLIVQGIMTLSIVLNYYGIYYHLARVKLSVTSGTLAYRRRNCNLLFKNIDHGSRFLSWVMLVLYLQ